MSNSPFDIYKKIAEATTGAAKTAAGVRVNSESGKGGIQNPQITALDNNYSSQSRNALDKYNTAKAQLDESRERAKAEAGANNAKLMKYMPSILKRQGLSGLGVSQSAVIAANNNYQTALTDIENDFQKNSADLLQNYNDAKLAYDTQYNSQKAQLEQAELDKQEAAKEKSEQKTAAEQSSNFENAWAIISADTTSTDFSELLAAYQGKVSDADYNTLVQLAASQVAKNQKAIKEKTKLEEDNNADTYEGDILLNLAEYSAAENYEGALKYLEATKEYLDDATYQYQKAHFETLLGKSGTGNDFGPEDAYDDLTEEEIKELAKNGDYFLSFSGRDYKLTEQLESGSAYLNNNADFTKQLESMGFNNPSDLNIPEGTVLVFRGDDTGSLGEFDLKILDMMKEGSPLVGAMATEKTLNEISSLPTYTAVRYDGKWYLAEDKGETKPLSTTPSSNEDPLGLYAQQLYANQSNTNNNSSLLNYLFAKK